MCDENHHTQITYVLTALLMDFQGVDVNINYKLLTWRHRYEANII